MEGNIFPFSGYQQQIFTDVRLNKSINKQTHNEMGWKLERLEN